MIIILNNGHRALRLDSTLSMEMKTLRPPLPGAVERLEQGDTLIIKVGRDVQITFADDILSIRGYNPIIDNANLKEN